jgi:hypothetical protein
MLNKNDLERLAQMRIDDAIQLLGSGRASGAFYLAGYSVELAIKACIAKLFQNNAIPDKALVNAAYTHNLDQLKNIAGLRADLEKDMSGDPKLGANWGIVTKWGPESRYDFQDQFAASFLIGAITDENHGVLEWVKKHW